MAQAAYRQLGSTLLAREQQVHRGKSSCWRNAHILRFVDKPGSSRAFLATGPAECGRLCPFDVAGRGYVLSEHRIAAQAAVYQVSALHSWTVADVP